jgi:hypothetical protein
MPLRLWILEDEMEQDELAEMDMRSFLASLDERERFLFDERAAIMEFEGGLTRAEAEKGAKACLNNAGELRYACQGKVRNPPQNEIIPRLMILKPRKIETLDHLRQVQMPRARLDSPVLIESGYLKDTFYLVVSEAQAREIEKAGGVCYLPAEVGVLLTNSTGMDEETLTNHLNKIHMLKKAFPGARVGRG